MWECGRRWLRAPPRGLWPFAQRNRKVTREPQAGPGHLSHPTWVTLSPFPVSVDGGFSGCVGHKQPQADVGQKPVGRLWPHPGGEQAGWDGESPGSTGCPGRRHVLEGFAGVIGGGLGREGSPRSRVGTRADTCFSWEQKFKRAEAAAILVMLSSVNSKRAWLMVTVISQLPTGCGR